MKNMNFFFLFIGNTFALEPDLKILDSYLKKIDKPRPGVELFAVKNIDYRSNAGFLCTHKQELSAQYDNFMTIFKREREKYTQCNFSAYLLYLFDQKHLDQKLISIIKKYEYKKYADFNYSIKSPYNKKTGTVAFICKDCQNKNEMITENVNDFFLDTCVKDPKDNFSQEQRERLKSSANKALRGK